MSNSNNLKLKMISKDNNNSEFIRFRATMRLPIPPIWGSNGSAGGEDGSGGMEGVKEVLAGWVMRYLPPLRAVLLTFDSIPTFAHPTSTFKSSSSPFPIQSTRRPNAANFLASPEPGASDEEEEESTTVQLKALPIIAGSGFTLANVEWQGLGWRPRVGQKITGSPTLSTPSHISLLIHNLFNASIPVSHIPSDTYHFDENFEVPASIQSRQTHSWPSLVATEVIEDEEEEEDVEEDAEAESSKVEPGSGEESEEDEQDEAIELAIEEEKLEEAEEEQYKEKGWWRHNVTKEPLGGENCRLEFTIVGLTIANSMISITGSLLSDPFSAINIEAVPKPKRSNSLPLRKRQRAHSESSGSGSDSDSDAPLPNVVAPPKVKAVASESEEESEPTKAELVTPKPKKLKKDKSEKKEKKEGKKVKKMKKEQ